MSLEAYEREAGGKEREGGREGGGGGGGGGGELWARKGYIPTLLQVLSFCLLFNRNEVPNSD